MPFPSLTVATPLAAAPIPQNVHLIDDDPAIVRLATAHLTRAGFDVSTYDSAEAFLEVCGKNACRGAVLLDLDLPGMSGSELQEEITRRELAMPVLVLSGTSDVGEAVGVMKRGALDLIRKPFDAAALVEGVHNALARAGEAETEAATQAELQRRYGKLTPREREVMGYVARGWANKQVAFELKLSERTVEVHRARVNQKMESESVAELVQMATTLGVLAESVAA